MKTILKSFLLYLTINLILFAACAFTLWDINVQNWSQATRGVIGVFGLGLGSLAAVMYYIENR